MSKLAAADLGSQPTPLGVLAFRGPDAARFLQGQLSADVEKLAPGSSTLAGLHNPQGRVVALLALARMSGDEVLAVLPAELTAAVSQRLRKYLLRSKLVIADGDYRVAGIAADIPGFTSLAWGSRRLLLVPPEQVAEFEFQAEATARWAAADVAEGLPQVYAATSETFVAQMLNLDLLGAISFDKGCYTGQEVVARAHYRGRVKRRLQRWSTDSSAPLRAGDAVRSTDGRALSIVSVAAVADGQELLAVGPYAIRNEAETEQVEPASPPDSGPRVAGPLPLPYRLPD